MAKSRCDVACVAYQAISDEIGLVSYKEKMKITGEVIEVLATMHDKDMSIDVRVASVEREEE